MQLDQMKAKLHRAKAKLMTARTDHGVPGVALALFQLTRRGVSIPFLLALELGVDLFLGVRTRGTVHHEGVLRERALGKDPEAYEPVRLHWWRHVRDVVGSCAEDYTFVDLGAGRGRALVLALRLGFRRVVGVELDADLAEQARQNVRRWLSRRLGARSRPAYDVMIVQGDAATFPLPPGPLIVTLFNPFGAETLRHVLTSVRNAIVSGASDRVLVAYFNPVHADVVAEFSWLSVRDRGSDWVIYLADAYRETSTS